MRVIKKPIEVEAVQWKGTQESLEEIKKLGGDIGQIHYNKCTDSLVVHDFTGHLGSEQAGINDWIIKGTDGKILHLCRSDIFEKTYDVVEDA